MKRLLTLAAMYLCCVATTFAQFSGSGSGTSGDPYLILNPTQLNQMRNFLNQSGVYFKLMTDIDLTDFLEDESPTQGWQPVGTSSAHFKGVLDGNGYSIKGLWISRNSTDYVGLFGYVENSTITNLTINASHIKGNDYTGIIAGYAKASTISECTLKGIVNGHEKVGGIIGYSTGVTISLCSLTSKGITGANYTGGLCGLSSSIDITSCYVDSNISGIDYVGGLLGGNFSELGINNITNSSFVGQIGGSNYLGGLVGRYISKAEMKGSYALAHVSGKGNNIGGLVGEVSYYTLYARYQYYPSLLNNYFYGVVDGKEQVGGLVGHVNIGIINYCYTHSSVSGIKNVGGVCGLIESESPNYKSQIFSNVVILSFVKATLNNVGRIYGEKGNNVSIGENGTKNENKAYNRAIVLKADVEQDITEDQQNGTGASLTTLKLEATYVAMGWNFTDTWEIQETECYPYFKTQTAPPVITSQLVSGATTISGKCVNGGTVTLEIDGVEQQKVSSGHDFSFNVSPLQAGCEVRIRAKAEGKEQSYYTTETVAYKGKGTEDDPYQVYTASELMGVYRKGYYKLMNDIDLTAYINQFSPTEGWESIGREGSETIHFDGNGYKITGLWCNSTKDNTGLFSCFANGTIKNLTVVTASGKQVKGGANTGILIGKMINGTIENCKVTGKVADGTPVGGLVGLFDGGKISLCHANVTTNTTGESSHVGGLVGVMTDVEIYLCFVQGTITATGEKSYVGGLVGETTSGEIDQCFTQGTLTATGKESYVAGLVGKNSATVTNCYGNATITSTYNAAGIVAYNYGVVDKCYAMGSLFSSNYAAGIIGYNDGITAIVKNCVALNNKIDVTYESQQQQQGGGYGQRIIGGLKNGAPAPEMNNYALKNMQVSVNNVAQKVYDDIMNGVGKTDTELKQKATYQMLGWNFTDIWNIDEGSSYPYQTVKAEGGSDPVNPNPEDPEPQTAVEVTDVSNMVNAIYVEPLKGSAGTDVNIEVKMKNANTATSYGFELVLPAGVTISTSTDGSFDDAVTMSTRHKGHTLTTNKLANNTYKVGVASLSSKALTDNDGLVLTIKAHVADNIAEGEYAIGVQSPLIVNTDGTKPAVKNTQSKITIEDYIKGDVDGDGVVDLADAVLVINHYVGKPVNKFVAKAADVDGDGVIDLADAVRIINFYVGKVQSLAPSINIDRLDPQ